MGTDWIILLINDKGTCERWQGNGQVKQVVLIDTTVLHLVRQRTVLLSIRSPLTEDFDLFQKTLSQNRRK